eukprot:scaffold1565_cov221-Amphora_coffeaeformis.AAC.14
MRLSSKATPAVVNKMRMASARPAPSKYSSEWDGDDDVVMMVLKKKKRFFEEEVRVSSGNGARKCRRCVE